MHLRDTHASLDQESSDPAVFPVSEAIKLQIGNHFLL